MRTLGFSVGHDKGAVIIENGKVVIGITQERLSRIKHDGAYQGGTLPYESILYCLNHLGITIKDINSIVYSTTELIDDVEEGMAVNLGPNPEETQEPETTQE
jgi:predicted NodU family carbamoyl transferase